MGQLEAHLGSKRHIGNRQWKEAETALAQSEERPAWLQLWPGLQPPCLLCNRTATEGHLLSEKLP